MIDIYDIQKKLENLTELFDSLEDSSQDKKYEILDFIELEKRELVGYIEEFIEECNK